MNEVYVAASMVIETHAHNDVRSVSKNCALNRLRGLIPIYRYYIYMSQHHSLNPDLDL